MVTKELKKKTKKKTENLTTNIEINGDVSNSNVNGITKGSIGETKEIINKEIPMEEILANIVAKIDHLGDLIEERFDKKVNLPHYKN